MAEVAFFPKYTLHSSIQNMNCENIFLQFVTFHDLNLLSGLIVGAKLLGRM